MRLTINGVAIACLLGSSAFAADAKKSDKDTYPGLVLGSDARGASVTNLQNEKIGEIQETLIEPASGLIRFAIIGVGGFLGMGETRVAVTVDRVRHHQGQQQTEVRARCHQRHAEERAQGGRQELRQALQQSDRRASGGLLARGMGS